MTASSFVMGRLFRSLLIVSCGTAGRWRGRQRLLFERISFFTVKREIEALDFRLFLDAQTHCEIDQFEQDERSHGSQYPCNDDARGLIQQLVGVAVDETGAGHVALRILEDRID